MAKLIVGSSSFDMTTWNLADIANGSVTSDGATEVDVTGAGGYFDYTLTGTGLGSFDGSGFPQSGTITGLTMEHDGKTPMTITGISIDASDFMSFVNGNDPAGLEAAIFSGNDSFTGREQNDVLYGYAGNDSFNLSKGGDDTVNGGDGNDLIGFGAAFTAADSVDGGAGTDKVELNGDYSAGVIFSATTMVNVETLTLHTGHSYSLTLNAATATSGQALEVYGARLTASETMTLDGSAVAGDLHLVGGAGNDTLIGGSGDDVIIDTAGNNTFDLSSGGDDSVRCGSGNDIILMGAALSSGDRIDGQGGKNVVVLNGDYSAGFEITGTEIQNVQMLRLARGHSYNLTLGSNDTVTDFDGSLLGANDTMILNASAAKTALKITGGGGNDVLIGGEHSKFDLSQGGNDTVTGGAGGDIFNFGNTLTAADTINGGSGGDDMIDLSGNYSSPLVLGPHTMTNIEGLIYTGDQDASGIDLVTNDGNVAAGRVLFLDLGTSDPVGSITFDGSAETDGSFNIGLSSSCVYTITGGAGNDTITLDALALQADSHFDGGGGYNTLDVLTPSTFSAQTITNIQALEIYEDTTVTTVDANVAAGKVLTVTLDGNGSEFNGAAETDGTFNISGFGTAIGGAGDDTITMTAINNPNQDEIFQGGGGADQLTNDATTGKYIYTAEYVYNAASDSTGASYDTITNFATPTDKFKLWTPVLAIDAAVTSGALSTTSFDADLAHDIGAAQLQAHQAVIFTPSSGTLAGDHFLVVDANGTAGYQAGQDLVILLDNATSLDLTTANFIT